MRSSPILIFLFSLIAIVGSLHSVTMIGVEIYRIFDRGKMVKHLSQEVLSLENELSDLKAIVVNQDDQTYIEQLARCIGYAYPDEVRYVTINSNKKITNPNCQ